MLFSKTGGMTVRIGIDIGKLMVGLKVELFLSLRDRLQFPEVMGTDSTYLTHFILRKLYLVMNHHTDKTDIKEEYHFFSSFYVLET